MLNVSRKWYEANKDAALALGKSGTKSESSKTGNEQFELAAWIATCRIMLNMDEFITRN